MQKRRYIYFIIIPNLTITLTRSLTKRRPVDIKTVTGIRRQTHYCLLRHLTKLPFLSEIHDQRTFFVIVLSYPNPFALWYVIFHMIILSFLLLFVLEKNSGFRKHAEPQLSSFSHFYYGFTFINFSLTEF